MNAGDKYKKLKDSLDDDYLKGTTHTLIHPKTPSRCFAIMFFLITILIILIGNSSGGNGGNGRNIASNNSNTRSGNVSFLQTGNVIAGADGRTRSDVQCLSCQAFGHYQDQCPTAVQLLQASIPPHHEGDDGGYELSFNQFDFSTPSRSIDNPPPLVLEL